MIEKKKKKKTGLYPPPDACHPVRFVITHGLRCESYSVHSTLYIVVVLIRMRAAPIQSYEALAAW